MPRKPNSRGALCVVPGLGLDARSWLRTLAALGRGPEAVLTLPAYGRPATPEADLSPAALAVGAAARLPRAGPVALLGHSSGCQVAAHLAHRAPEVVRALVLVGPTTDPRAAGWPPLALRWLRTAGHEDPRQVPALVGQYRRSGLRAMARAMDAARRDRIDEVLRGVRCPVLVLRGAHDRICPADWAASLGACRTLSGGGHMVPWTHGAEVAAHVRGFLALPAART